MSEKESGAEVSHSRLAEASGIGSQQYLYKKQFKSKKEKRGGRPSHHGNRPYNTGSDSQVPYQYHSKPRASYPGSVGQRWSEQRKERQEGGVKGESFPHRSARRPRSSGAEKKKPTPVSLNHLLNFTVASHGRHSGGGSLPPRRRRRRGTHSYNKEQFLQANCQFVVSASGDYSVHSGDPDRLVDWDKIEQVRLFCHQIPSCPICLYPPRAAKISRCGHVYCWSCVLHYLSLGDKKWRKCPICYESIYKSDLKSVTALSSPQYRVGDTVTMKLMMREKGTTESIPKSCWAGRKQGLSVLEDTASSQFVKLLAATPSQVLEGITGPEGRELTAQLNGLGEDEVSEQCFVESALEELKARELILKQAQSLHQEVKDGLEAIASADNTAPKVLNVKTTASSSSSGSKWEVYADNYFDEEFEAPFSESDEEEEEEEEEEIEEEEEDEVDTKTILTDRSPEVESMNSSAQEVSPQAHKPSESNLLLSQDVTTQLPSLATLAAPQEDPPSIAHGHSPSSSPRSHRSSEQQEQNESGSAESSPLSHAKASPAGSPPTSPTNGDYIYFYQASDGQHLYIHPVNARCLVKEYGGLEYSPEEITACIVEMEQHSMTEDLRGRYRYLSHLPLTCEFVLCELDLRPPLLSRDTLRVFSDELQRRRQKRLKKKRDEKRREKKAEVKFPQSDVFPILTSPHRLTPERFHDFLSLSTSPPLPYNHNLHQIHHNQERPTTATEEPTKVETDRSQSNGGPPTSDTPSAPSFAQALQGKSPPVWPIKSTSSSRAPHQKSSPQSGRQQEGEEEQTSVPSFQEAFNDALISASVAAHQDSGGRPGSKTAKKGRKKLVLFSTGGARGAN